MASFRLASAVSLVALGSMIAGCATSQRTAGATNFGGKANGEVGLATRALTALNAKDFATAIAYGERAVERTPDDAGFRALLGNAYFAGGRFASAEAAYKDSLTIYAQQPQVILKLALAQISLGKADEATRLLASARAMLDPADYGLALALAGQPAEAVAVLDTAARGPETNARVRQNLALAHALSGDWTQARVVAGQDVPADQLDERMDQWMRLARPGQASAQVASLTGITPAASDPGQPVRLALRKAETQVAEAAPAAAAPAPAPQPAFAEAAPLPPVAMAAANPVPAFAPSPPPAPVAAEATKPAPAVAEAPKPAPVDVPDFVAASAPEAVYSAPKPVKAKAPAKRAPVVKAALRSGGSNAVMQLGSYRSPEQVAAGWNTLTRRYPALRAYLPMRARFDSPKGTFWRLSIQGFANRSEAVARCELLRSRGGACFVRGAAGDAPVRIASR